MTFPRSITALAAAALLIASARVGLAGQPATQEAALRTQIAELQRQIDDQVRQLAAAAEVQQRQQEEIDRLRDEVAELTARLNALLAANAQPAGTSSAGTTQGLAGPPGQGRDAVGDLNAAAVMAGDFPGSIRIPGTGRVSVAIGGFLKTVAISDTNVESAGPIFMPAAIGTSRPDADGNVSIDATLSRVNFDARAPTGAGGLRGYFEMDLNGSNSGTPSFNLRHAYGAWTSSRGTLTFGQTWSTLMDLQILPEGLTEPTVSGAIFQRQAQIRWSQRVSDRVRVDLAAEDPSNRDVITDQPVVTPSRLPDLIAAGQADWAGRGHLRVAGIYRRVSVEDQGAHGWALSVGAHVNLSERDRLAGTLNYGDGGGRYLLGLPANLGAFVDPGTGELRLIVGRGGAVIYRHGWTGRVRSTVAYGRAGTDRYAGVPGDAFRQSTFVLANLLVSQLPYLTWGFEYQYGVRKDQSDSTQDNHRLIFALQVF